MKSMLRTVDDHGQVYPALLFWCPGCQYLDEDGEPHGGLHMLPVGAPGEPRWDFDGNLDAPTLNPSILTRTNRPEPFVCHSFLRAGRFEFLGDCTHALAGQTVELPDLPDWVTQENQPPGPSADVATSGPDPTQHRRSTTMSELTDVIQAVEAQATAVIDVLTGHNDQHAALDAEVTSAVSTLGAVRDRLAAAVQAAQPAPAAPAAETPPAHQPGEIDPTTGQPFA